MECKKVKETINLTSSFEIFSGDPNQLPYPRNKFKIDLNNDDLLINGSRIDSNLNKYCYLTFF